MSDCIFCRIASGEIPARVVYSDDHLVAFHDLNPKAPTHLLVIPRRHITALSATDADDTEILGRLTTAVAALARQLELVDGYRLVVNSGAAAGQTVFHLHFHLLGGRDFSWPPG